MLVKDFAVTPVGESNIKIEWQSANANDISWIYINGEKAIGPYMPDEKYRSLILRTPYQQAFELEIHEFSDLTIPQPIAIKPNKNPLIRLGGMDSTINDKDNFVVNKNESLILNDGETLRASSFINYGDVDGEGSVITRPYNFHNFGTFDNAVAVLYEDNTATKYKVSYYSESTEETVVAEFPIKSTETEFNSPCILDGPNGKWHFYKIVCVGIGGIESNATTLKHFAIEPQKEPELTVLRDVESGLLSFAID